MPLTDLLSVVGNVTWVHNTNRDHPPTQPKLLAGVRGNMLLPSTASGVGPNGNRSFLLMHMYAACSRAALSFMWKTRVSMENRLAINPFGKRTG